MYKILFYELWPLNGLIISLIHSAVVLLLKLNAFYMIFGLFMIKICIQFIYGTFNLT